MVEWFAVSAFLYKDWFSDPNEQQSKIQERLIWVREGSNLFRPYRCINVYICCNIFNTVFKIVNFNCCNICYQLVNLLILTSFAVGIMVACPEKRVLSLCAVWSGSTLAVMILLNPFMFFWQFSNWSDCVDVQTVYELHFCHKT